MLYYLHHYVHKLGLLKSTLLEKIHRESATVLHQRFLLHFLTVLDAGF